MVEEALARIEGTSDHLSLVMGCALALEAAWTGLIPVAEATERYETLLASSVMSHDDSGKSVLAFWARRLDLPPPEGHMTGPAGLEWRGSVAEAAQSWAERGFPVDAAITRAMLPGADLSPVIADLNRLGADGVIRGLRAELQRRGVRHIPRGVRPSTRRNPAGLTPRQAEVLSLLASGLSNAGIAEQLFISDKTASHHVSAVLAKLQVSSRAQAIAVASANGWLGRETQTR